MSMNIQFCRLGDILLIIKLIELKNGKNGVLK